MTWETQNIRKVIGFNRLAQLDDFKGLNISSFDSTFPLLKAFKGDTNNYYAWLESYKAIRIPPVSRTRLKQKIQGGILNLERGQAALPPLEAMRPEKLT